MPAVDTTVDRPKLPYAIGRLNVMVADMARTKATVADPTAFTRDTLAHDHWSVPVAILEALNQPNARVAVKSCHSSGKTYTAADALLWWVASGGIAISTAPTWVQVQRLLWGYVHRAYRDAKRSLGGVLNQTEWRITADNYGIGLSTNEGVRFQGFHGRVLIILDEAVGVRADIWEAIDGIRAGGDVRELALGNPTIPSGPFFDAFSANRAGWTTFTIDAFDTPNLRDLPGATADQREAYLAALAPDSPELDIALRPYLVTRRWAYERFHEWGPASPMYQSRVRAMFPLQSEDSLISLAWLEAARLRDVEPGEIVAGADVAGPGEDVTCVTVRSGGQILDIKAWSTPDPRGAVLAYLREFDGLRRLNVDSAGIGWNFYLHMRDNLPGVTVTPINVGEKPHDSEKYANLKAELYWGLRQRFQAGEIGGLTNDTAVSQLASIRYDQTPTGKIAIESKEAAQKRGVKSPDFAESMMLAFGETVAPAGGNLQPALATGADRPRARMFR